MDGYSGSRLGYYSTEGLVFYSGERFGGCLVYMIASPSSSSPLLPLLPTIPHTPHLDHKSSAAPSATETIGAIGIQESTPPHRARCLSRSNGCGNSVCFFSHLFFFSTCARGRNARIDRREERRNGEEKVESEKAAR